MDHTITVGGILLSLAVLVGLAMAAIGGLMAFAGGMSDAPAEGAAASKQGCFVFCLGCALVVGGIWGLLS